MRQKTKTDTSKLYKSPIFIYFCIGISTKNLEEITEFYTGSIYYHTSVHMVCGRSMSLTK